MSYSQRKNRTVAIQAMTSQPAKTPNRHRSCSSTPKTISHSKDWLDKTRGEIIMKVIIIFIYMFTDDDNFKKYARRIMA